MISFAVPLTMKDWSSDQNGWTSALVKVPGLTVDGIYSHGRISEQSYSVDSKNGVVHWRDTAGERPKRVLMSVTIPVANAESPWWKRFGIVVPIIAACITVGGIYLTQATAATKECEVWRVEGGVNLADAGLRDENVRIGIDPPDLWVDGQGKFSWDIPVQLGPNEKPIFPRLSFNVNGTSEPFRNPPSILLGTPSDIQVVAEKDRTIKLTNINFEKSPSPQILQQAPPPVVVK